MGSCTHGGPTPFQVRVGPMLGWMSCHPFGLWLWLWFFLSLGVAVKQCPPKIGRSAECRLLKPLQGAGQIDQAKLCSILEDSERSYDDQVASGGLNSGVPIIQNKEIGLEFQG